MNKSELIASLRELANRIESSALPDSLGANLNIGFHEQIASREQLAVFAKFLKQPTAEQNKGTAWLQEGDFMSDCNIAVYYPSGLLGKTRTVKVREVVKEKNQKHALASLLQETA